MAYPYYILLILHLVIMIIAAVGVLWYWRSADTMLTIALKRKEQAKKKLDAATQAIQLNNNTLIIMLQQDVFDLDDLIEMRKQCIANNLDQKVIEAIDKSFERLL